MVPKTMTLRLVTEPPARLSGRDLADRFLAVRQCTARLTVPLSAEDQAAQPMPDASPTKWHLAHTTWFFERFVLDRASGGPPFDPAFDFLFNSYYEAVGPRVERASRGMLTRPGLDRVRSYRAAIDARVVDALTRRSLDDGALACLELGLHHEQQHQELILTDAKYTLGTQPLQPAYASLPRATAPTAAPLSWHSYPGGIVEIGAPGDGFAFDNERPRHRALVHPYKLASRPVANADVLGFIADGGYRDHRLWLSDGWRTVQTERWSAPLYWSQPDGNAGNAGAGSWQLYDLAGVRPVEPGETACHLSLYEADAIARWLGARLPSEAEWEHAAQGLSTAGNLLDAGHFHPAAAFATTAPAQLFGDVWEWTSSSYSAYPGFRPLDGALGEYNGKFMSGQHVLRGGSCFTPADHIRQSYRNFFPPAARWQMTGVRLAQDA